MDKLLLTPPEAAMMLGIGRTKLYELIRSGELVSITIDRARRIPRVAAEAYVARRCGLPVHSLVGDERPAVDVAIASGSSPVE
jgi:excisionase family DNA binding protein